MTNIFDIIGPVMIGPSSSHTAGAARMGMIARKLLGSIPKRAEITLFDSFAKTGKGHGTDKALIAGILGFGPDDARIRDSFAHAEECGLKFKFVDGGNNDYHPNTARIVLHGDNDSIDTIIASVGGGMIKVMEINRMSVSINAELCTTIIFSKDQKGTVAAAAKILTDNDVNIAFMQLFRSEKTGNTIMVFETDQSVPKNVLEILKSSEHTRKVAYIDNTATDDKN